MIDFKRDPTYRAKTEPEIITVPEMLFVTVTGEGAPEGSEDGNTAFQQAMEILFGITYTIKFWDKKYRPPKGYDKFTMAPVEALWWTASGNEFDVGNPGDWRWTAMLRLPEFVSKDYFSQVVDVIAAKKQSDIFHRARLEHFTEGLTVQILHIGPYDQETPNIKKMHEFAREQGYELHGKHHELYFGDPRRTAPEKLRTILRRPICK